MGGLDEDLAGLGSHIHLQTWTDTIQWHNHTHNSWFTTSAFVHQHEMLHPYLTPRETLQFHAAAR